MSFYDEGANIRTPNNRKTATWFENTTSAEGYVFSERTLQTYKGETLDQIDLKVLEYGRVLIGIFFKNPEEYRSRMTEFFDSSQSEDVRNIRYLTLKNQKTAHVEFKYVPGLDNYIEYMDSTSPDKLRIGVSKKQRSVWIFVRFLFGDIRVSMRDRRGMKCPFKQFDIFSSNTQLNPDGSAQLKDGYAGSRCKIDHPLKSGDKLTLNVTPLVQRGEGRSVFRILFTSEHADARLRGNEPPYVYQENNYRGDVIIHYRGNSVLCGDQVICNSEYQNAVKMHIEMVFSRVEIVPFEYHLSVRPKYPRRSVMPMCQVADSSPYLDTDVHNTVPKAVVATRPTRNLGIPMQEPTAYHQEKHNIDNSVLCRNPQYSSQPVWPMSQVLAYGPYTESDSSNSVPNAVRAKRPTIDHEVHIKEQTHVENCYYDNPATCAHILRSNYDVLVKCIDYRGIADILYRKGIMEVKDHRKITSRDHYGTDEDAKGRHTLNWMIDNEDQVSETELEEIFDAVHQIKLLAKHHK